jgi:hypothetical protein
MLVWGGRLADWPVQDRTGRARERWQGAGDALAWHAIDTRREVFALVREKRGDIT